MTSGPMTLSDVARAAGLPRATARRILFTLEHGGFVSSDGKLFTLTPHVLTLAGSLSALEPGRGRAAASARPHRQRGAGNLFARGARWRRCRLHRARQPGAACSPPVSTSAIGCRRSAPRSAVPCSASSMTTSWRSGSSAMRARGADVADGDRSEAAADGDRRRPRQGLFAGRSRSRAAFPFDLGAGPPLRRRHRRRHQHGRPCRPRAARKN